MSMMPYMVHPAGFEPATPWFEAKYSNPLSYGCAILMGKTYGFSHRAGSRSKFVLRATLFPHLAYSYSHLRFTNLGCLTVYYLIRETEEKVVTIQTVQEAEAALLPYVPLVAQLTGKDTTLERILPLMELLGNPQDKLRIIHIAGTSGKTSTAYYTAALLQATGNKMGLTVSPHVDSITERVQVNGLPLPENDFCQELGVFLDIIRQAAQPPSYFELLYAFALWVFERRHVDYAVVETGMGGLHDSTNVAARADKVCVITDIGFDHMHVLGYTLPEIAAQKIGITHPGNVVIMYEQADEIMAVVRDWIANQQGATLQLTTEAAERSTNDTDWSALPLYQQRNWLLAHRVYEYLRQRDRLQNLTSQVLQQTQAVQVPGRMDKRIVNDKTIIMDGAHNAQKMVAFIDSFQVLFPNVKPAILFALKEGKEYQAVVPLLASLSSRIIVTTFDTSQDLPAKSLDPQLLAAAFCTNPGLPVEIITDHVQAYARLLAVPETVCVVTGSFYLLSQIRKISA